MLAAGRPRIWLEKVPAPGSRATEVFPTPPPLLSRAGVFLGSGEAPADQRIWWPSPGFRSLFNTTRASYLRVASPGFPPTPSPAGERPPGARGAPTRTSALLPGWQPLGALGGGRVPTQLGSAALPADPHLDRGPHPGPADTWAGSGLRGPPPPSPPTRWS